MQLLLLRHVFAVASMSDIVGTDDTRFVYAPGDGNNDLEIDMGLKEYALLFLVLVRVCVCVCVCVYAHGV